ncbi:hypothetical protein D3C77_523370 [compost metagenome]
MKRGRATGSYTARLHGKCVNALHIRWQGKLAVRIKANGYYAAGQVRILRYVGRIAVHVCPFPFLGHKQLITERIINHTDDHFASIRQCERYAEEWKAMYEISRAIYRIHDPQIVRSTRFGQSFR